MNVISSSALFFGASLICFGLFMAGKLRFGNSYNTMAASTAFVFLIVICLKALPNRQTQSPRNSSRNWATRGHPRKSKQSHVQTRPKPVSRKKKSNQKSTARKESLMQEPSKNNDPEAGSQNSNGSYQNPTFDVAHDQRTNSNKGATYYEFNQPQTPSKAFYSLLAKTESVHSLASDAIPQVEPRQDLHDRADVQLTDPMFMAIHNTDPSGTTYPDSAQINVPNSLVNDIPMSF